MFRKVSVMAVGAMMAATAMVEAGMHGSKDIVDTAVSDGNFMTLIAAVEAAGLVETLQGDGPFTVFAPTDEAFARLPEGTVEDLLKPENREMLVAVLTYHVVPGKVMSGDIAGKQINAATVQGEDLSIDATDGVEVNEAKVIVADIKTSNGVIHVIDTVLIP
ncbi:MAG: fasciclin domain-containing protein [Rhodospirillales bacterium]|nr:fasciclin domain-containing protein [Rhodospirillales bacterium]